MTASQSWSRQRKQLDAGSLQPEIRSRLPRILPRRMSTCSSSPQAAVGAASAVHGRDGVGYQGDIWISHQAVPSVR
jgi:hypothetical protein